MTTMTDRERPKWRYYHVIQGAYEIAREGAYARGTICACHSIEDAALVVNALNELESGRNSPAPVGLAEIIELIEKHTGSWNGAERLWYWNRNDAIQKAAEAVLSRLAKAEPASTDTNRDEK